MKSRTAARNDPGRGSTCGATYRRLRRRSARRLRMRRRARAALARYPVDGVTRRAWGPRAPSEQRDGKGYQERLHQRLVRDRPYITGCAAAPRFLRGQRTTFPQQRLRDEIEAEVAAWHRTTEWRRWWRNRQRRRWPGWPPEVVRLFCIADGMNLGGRPARSRRCTKRRGSRVCWNWREPRADRCWRHARQT